MIVVDTSALMAIVLDEPQADRCVARIAETTQVLIAAPTLAETLIVAGGRKVGDAMQMRLLDLQLTVLPLTAERARLAAEAYRRWGKGVHRASLNICDVFAYQLATEHGCPLLYVGGDFARTDVVAA